jgi:hypothetical protein
MQKILCNKIDLQQKMTSYEMLRRVALVKTDIFSETSVLTSATWRNIPEDVILHSHRRENIKSYIALTGWTL